MHKGVETTQLVPGPILVRDTKIQMVIHGKGGNQATKQSPGTYLVTLKL